MEKEIINQFSAEDKEQVGSLVTKVDKLIQKLEDSMKIQSLEAFIEERDLTEDFNVWLENKTRIKWKRK